MENQVQLPAVGNIGACEVEVPSLPAEVIKGGNPSKVMAVAKQFHLFYDAVWVENLDCFFIKGPDGVYYPIKKKPLRVLMSHIWGALIGDFTTQNLSEMMEIAEVISPKRVERPTSDYIMVSQHIFWDKLNGELTPDVEDGDIFYRLFNTKTTVKGIVKVPPFSPAQEKILWDTYARVKEEIEKGVEEERFEPLKVWANGNHDVYMDLHRAHAYMFLKKKPVGSYLLIGERRNGKSAYAKMTHTIMGAANTSGVQLGELNDWHKNHDLIGSLMNAPDEEDDTLLDKAATFKTMADHGQIRLPTMASNVGADLDCDFMCFFPMNHIPNWKGSGAGACVARSLIIPFTAKLGKLDNANDDFAERTFTADFMAEYMGSVFAYAWYYHRHPMVFSDTMKRYQESYEEDLNNASIYKQLFEKYFDGYTKFSLLYADYILWCKEKGSKIKSRDELKVVFGEYVSAKRSSARLYGEVKSVQRVPQPNHDVLSEKFIGKGVEAYETVKDLHIAEKSIITVLESYMEQRYEKGVVNEPSR